MSDPIVETPLVETAAIRAWSLPEVQRAVISFLPLKRQIDSLTLSKQTFPRAVASVYERIRESDYKVLCSAAPSSRRLVLYAEAVKHVTMADKDDILACYKRFPRILDQFPNLTGITAGSSDIRILSPFNPVHLQIKLGTDSIQYDYETLAQDPVLEWLEGWKVEWLWTVLIRAVVENSVSEIGNVDSGAVRLQVKRKPLELLPLFALTIDSLIVTGDVFVSEVDDLLARRATAYPELSPIPVLKLECLLDRKPSEGQLARQLPTQPPQSFEKLTVSRWHLGVLKHLQCWVEMRHIASFLSTDHARPTLALDGLNLQLVTESHPTSRGAANCLPLHSELVRDLYQFAGDACAYDISINDNPGWPVYQKTEFMTTKVVYRRLLGREIIKQRKELAKSAMRVVPGFRRLSAQEVGLKGEAAAATQMDEM